MKDRTQEIPTPDRQPQYAILTLNGLQLSTYVTGEEWVQAEKLRTKLKVPFLAFEKVDGLWRLIDLPGTILKTLAPAADTNPGNREHFA